MCIRDRLWSRYRREPHHALLRVPRLHPPLRHGRPPEGLFADKDHSPALGDKSIAEMGSQKTGAPVPTARFEFMLSCRSSGPRRNAIGVRVRASNAVIAEAFIGHHLGIQIAPVNYDGIVQVLADTVEIKVGEFFLLREDQQSIGAMGRLISGAGEGDAERLLPGRAPWPWIAALLYKRLSLIHI